MEEAERNQMLELLLILNTEEDRVAFQEIYEKSYLKLLYTARGIIHNVHDAEEIVHDVYAKIADNFSRYRRFTLEQMVALGIVMTRNACINKIHFRQKYPEISFEEKEDFIGKGNILEDVVKEETIDELALAYRKLKQKDRDILTLRYGYDLSYKDISSIMGMSEKTVDMRLYRAKTRLKKVLQHKKKNK